MKIFYSLFYVSYWTTSAVVSVVSQCRSTPATMSRQHSTLLPKTATMSNEFCVEISTKSSVASTKSNVASTLLLVWTGLYGHIRECDGLANNVPLSNVSFAAVSLWWYNTAFNELKSMYRDRCSAISLRRTQQKTDTGFMLRPYYLMVHILKRRVQKIVQQTSFDRSWILLAKKQNRVLCHHL